MKKIVISPDSYKGTLSARQAAEIIERACKDALESVETVSIPIADGGEGTVDALGAERVPCVVTDAFSTPISAFYGRLGDAAVIELAACAGLPQATHPNPEIASTFGVGELIRFALDAGFRRFIIALGGSSTNDMGCGLASALGVHFFDEDGARFVPTGKTLNRIAKIDCSGMDPRIRESRFTTMCDVTNPLFGPKGAAYVFAPQKGADPEMVARLDQGLVHACEVVKRDLGVDLSTLPGAGAAGGCGGGVVAFLSSELKSGIDVVLDLKGFDRALENADLVFTGEGKFDSQSLDGKAISGIARRCLEKKVPLVVLAGFADESLLAYERGVTAVFSIQRRALPLSEAAKINDISLYKTVYNIVKLWIA